ncbi:MAG: hypothetical protein K8R39_12485 [Arcobacteraceae bacterium]|nr:hypothetical protein [Arcobacteraceae bacterium]
MIQEYEIKDYITQELSKGQTVEVLTDHVVEHTDMLTFIVTKHNGDRMNISRTRKIAYVKNYIENVQQYG